MKGYVANGKRAKKSRNKAKNAKVTRRRNALPLIIGNPIKRRKTIMAKKSNKVRRHRMAGKNPLARPRRRRHSRNPFVGDSAANNAKLVAGAAGGLLGDVYIPAWLLGLMNQPDSGMWSYIIAALVVILPAWAFSKVNWNNVAKGWLAGAGAGFIWRAIDDATGMKYVQIQSGMGSFLTQQQVALPGVNIFGQFNRRAQPQLMASSGASPAAVSTPVSKGVGYVKFPYAA